MKRTVNITDARRQLSALAAAGDGIVLTRRGRAVARLILISRSPARRRHPANALGVTWIAPDFNAPLAPDVLESFGIRRGS
jgi:antitoxin (DNA-binding transcriptional repressor) of toxin-antitoxin stability system